MPGEQQNLTDWINKAKAAYKRDQSGEIVQGWHVCRFDGIELEYAPVDTLSNVINDVSIDNGKAVL